MPLPVISIEQMREWERASWAAGRSQSEVIRHVGHCVARMAVRLTRPGDGILILAGKGNNGADAQAAREHLPERQVDVLEVENPATELSKLNVLLSRRPGLVIDGLFGIGLNRPLDATWVEFISQLNAARLRVLAVDVPSGLNADTGEALGAAVEATVTLTVGAPKSGLLEQAAWQYVGRLEVAADVGLVPCPCSGDLNWTVPEDFAGYPPTRPVAGHKGDHGHLAIIAGSVGYHGAAVLAARGAQRSQPGRITLITQESAYAVVAAQSQAVMVHPWNGSFDVSGRYSAVLMGPGLAAADLPDQIKRLARRLWTDLQAPMIVDASALDWLPFDYASKHAVRVVTPHPGEAARLLKSKPAQVQANRVQALHEVSRLFGDCWVVLKGHQTIVGRHRSLRRDDAASAEPHEVHVNPSGNPYLAQGGAGDILSGYLAGLLAQPALQADVGRAIRYAAWQHGAAADQLQMDRPNWTMEDLARLIGAIRPPNPGSEG